MAEESANKRKTRGFGRFHSHHVLFICYDFPGIWGAGVIRTYQLAKNLPSFGWQPIILTAHSCSGGQEDSIEASDGYLTCPKFTVAPSRVLVPFQTDHRIIREPFDGVAPENNDILKRMLRLSNELAVPDGKLGWLRAAAQHGLQIARDYSIKMCFSISPRPTSHLVARRVARSLGIPWVADFTLPWSDAYWLSGRPGLIRWIDQRLEGSVIRAAAHITVAYADLARSICARFGTAWDKKISVIPTGYDDDLFKLQGFPIPSKFRVVYPGNHFCEDGRHGECFLKGVDEWIGLNPRLKDEVEVVFIGKRDDELLRQRAAMAHSKVIRVEPLTSHRACIQAIVSSHLCVVNTVGNRVPSKVYECMRAGKRVLALAGLGSDLENLMRGYSKGISIPAQETSAIRNALETVWQGDLRVSERIEADPAVESYSSKHSAETVSRIFDSLLLSRGD